MLGGQNKLGQEAARFECGAQQSKDLNILLLWLKKAEFAQCEYLYTQFLGGCKASLFYETPFK